MPDFDDDGRDEDLNPPGLEVGHDRFLFLALHPAVDQSDFEFRENIPLQVLGHLGGVLQVQALGFLHQGIDDVGLLSFGDFFPQECDRPGIVPFR